MKKIGKIWKQCPMQTQMRATPYPFQIKGSLEQPRLKYGMNLNQFEA